MVTFAKPSSTRTRRTICGGLTVGLVTTGLFALTPPSASADTPAPGCYQSYVVPQGVHALTVTAIGGAGSPGQGYSGGVVDHGGGAGGLGAKVVDRGVPVEPGQTLYYGVASAGGGYRGQGYDLNGGDGGRASFVASAVPGACAAIKDSSVYLVVAGGGGGGGAGDQSGPGGTGGSAGATASDGNAGGTNGRSAGGGGGGGTNTAGGAGGSAGLNGDNLCFCLRRSTPGSPGDGIYGGEGGGEKLYTYSFAGGVYLGPSGGGGGGGGYFGGGGGGGDGDPSDGFTQGTGGGGGGAGASYPSPVQGAVITTTTEAPSVSFKPEYDTTTTLTSSASPAAPGSPVTFSSQSSVVNTDGNPIVGGYVHFTDLGDPNDFQRQQVSLGSVPVSIGFKYGTASLTVPNLAPGIHRIEAYYSGFIGNPPGTTQPQDAVDHAPSLVFLTEVISKPQTISFTSTSVARTGYGPTYTPTATSTSGLPVTFSIDAASTDNCSISGSTVSFQASGTCTIDADQAGNDSYLPAAQVQQSITVVGAGQQAITFTSTPPADLQPGQLYPLAASGGASGQPVVFSVDAHEGCVIFNDQYEATVGGTCVVHANQAGGNGYAPAAQVDQAVTAQPTSQTVTFTTSMPGAPNIGDTYAAQAYAFGGSVVLSLDPTSTGCTLTNLGQKPGGGFAYTVGTITYTARGTCVLDGNQPGNLPYYAAAPQVQQSTTVLGAAQTVSFTSTAPAAVVGDTYNPTTTTSVPGASVTLATSTPATCTTAATGTVTFTAAGTCTLTADVAGDAVYAPATQATQDITVAKQRQAVGFTDASPAAPVVGDTYTPQVTGGGSDNPVTVGTATPATCTSGNGTVNFVAAGTCTVTLDQAGNDQYSAAAQVTRDLTVGPGTQQIRITSSPGYPSRIGDSYQLIGVGGESSQPVVIGTSTPATCTATGTEVTFLAVGTCTVTADQAADANYTAAAQVTQDVQVQPGVQAIGFTAPATGVVGGQDTLTATGGASTSPVTFRVDDSTASKVCTVDGTTVRYTHTGTCVIDADQAADANYLPAPQFRSSITVLPGVRTAPSIDTADHATFAAGSAESFTITTSGLLTASLSETGSLPDGVTFTDNGDGTATLAGTPAAGAGGAYPLTLTASNGVDPDATQAFTLSVTDPPVVISGTSTTFTVGSAGSFPITTTAGYPAATTLTESGALPAGVTFTDHGDGTGGLVGTPVNGSAGSYPLTLTATNSAGSTSQALTLLVTLAGQTVTFTSSPPSPAAVVGQTYVPTATGGGSTNPVSFHVDGSSASVCTLAGAKLTFTHPGSCLVDAAQAADGTYAAASSTQTIAVSTAATATTLRVAPHTVTAAVTVNAPGAGVPSGTVTFAVDGVTVGTAPLTAGTATLPYSVRAGHSHNVSAVYSGDGDFTGSSASTARHDPRLTATVSSSAARSAYGWYRTPVTVTFHCTAAGAALSGPCPKPVSLTRGGAGESVTRTVQAADGGTASVTVSGINIDLTAPRVAITGVENGATYPGQAPAAHCTSSDALSGLDHCTLTRYVLAETVTIAATARDRAGNTRTVSVRYTVARFYVAGAAYRNGAYQVRAGHTYVIVALTDSTTRPRYYDAAPRGGTLHPSGQYLQRSGTQSGLRRYTLLVRIDRGMNRYKIWNLGVRSASDLHLIAIEPHA